MLKRLYSKEYHKSIDELNCSADGNNFNGIELFIEWWTNTEIEVLLNETLDFIRLEWKISPSSRHLYLRRNFTSFDRNWLRILKYLHLQFTHKIVWVFFLFFFVVRNRIRHFSFAHFTKPLQNIVARTASYLSYASLPCRPLRFTYNRISRDFHVECVQPPATWSQWHVCFSF